MARCARCGNFEYWASDLTEISFENADRNVHYTVSICGNCVKALERFLFEKKDKRKPPEGDDDDK